jgi:hypothetical protein
MGLVGVMAWLGMAGVYLWVRMMGVTQVAKALRIGGFVSVESLCLSLFYDSNLKDSKLLPTYAVCL